LPGDYYNFDAAKQRLTGERSGRSFKLGGSVQVQVARVDLDDKKIDLELIDSASSEKASDKKGRGKSKPKSKSKPRDGKPDKGGARKKPKSGEKGKQVKKQRKPGRKPKTGPKK